MTRAFCDVCNTEIRHNYVADRLKGNVRIGKMYIGIEVMLGVSNQPVGATNSGDLCLPHLKQALELMLERETETAALIDKTITEGAVKR